MNQDKIPIYQAIENDDYAFVQDYLENEWPLIKNRHPHRPYYMLLEAISYEHVDLVRLLLRYTSPNRPDDFSDHALFLAYHEIMKELLSAGADPNIYNEHGQSLLNRCVDDNDYEGVSLLLEHGADVNDEDLFGTPLITAVKNGNSEMVKLLLNYGADPELPDAYGRTAYDIARERDLQEIVDLFDYRDAVKIPEYD
jgi:ankyrin repeat protein